MKFKRNIKNKISKIAQQIINCDKNCDGVYSNLKEGVIPRGLILETEGRKSNAKGCIVIGINPGKASKFEKNYYREKYIENKGSINYENLLFLWENGWKNKKPVKNCQYFQKLRKISNGLGLKGPIIWTNLAKCQNQDPPLQTIRTCVGTYLKKELELFPSDWPIIAAGREPYILSACLCPNHIIIGVTHPSERSGRFDDFFDEDNILYKKFQINLNKLWDGKRGEAIWLADIRKKKK